MRLLLIVVAAAGTIYGVHWHCRSFLNVSDMACWLIALGAAALVSAVLLKRGVQAEYLPKIRASIQASNNTEAARLLDQLNTTDGCVIALLLFISLPAMAAYMYYAIPDVPQSTMGIAVRVGIVVVVASVFILILLFALRANATTESVLKEMKTDSLTQAMILLEIEQLKLKRGQKPRGTSTEDKKQELENLNTAVKLLAESLKPTETKPAGNNTKKIGQTAPTKTGSNSQPKRKRPTSNSNPSTPPTAGLASTSGRRHGRKPPHVVFINYSSVDKEVADRLCMFMEKTDIPCWIAPRDVIPGASWGEALIEAIGSARVFDLLLSSNSNSSPQVQREVERAVSKGIAVIPFRIEDVPPSKSIEYFISNTHWLDAFNQPIETHCEQLAGVVRSLIGMPLPAAPTTQQQKNPVRSPAATVAGSGITKSPASGTSKKRQPIFAALLDALCCVMMADGKADAEEENKIVSIMQRVKAPQSETAVREHFDRFYVQVAKHGFASVLDECIKSAEVFKTSGKQQVILQFLDELANADGNVHESETKVIKSIESAIMQPVD